MRKILLLTLLLSSSAAFAEQYTVLWDASVSTPPGQVVGYRVKWGAARGGPYPNVMDVGNVLTAPLTAPAPPIAVVVQAYGAGTLVSPNSVEAFIPGTPAPVILRPGNFQIIGPATLTIPAVPEAQMR